MPQVDAVGAGGDDDTAEGRAARKLAQASVVWEGRLVALQEELGEWRRRAEALELRQAQDDEMLASLCARRPAPSLCLRGVWWIVCASPRL